MRERELSPRALEPFPCAPQQHPGGRRPARRTRRPPAAAVWCAHPPAAGPPRRRLPAPSCTHGKPNMDPLMWRTRLPAAVHPSTALLLRWPAEDPHAEDPTGILVKMTCLMLYSMLYMPINPLTFSKLAAHARKSAGWRHAARAAAYQAKGARVCAQAHTRRWGAHRAAADVWLSMAAAAPTSAAQAPRASAMAGYPPTSRTRCCSQKRTTWARDHSSVIWFSSVKCCKCLPYPGRKAS